MNTSPRQELPTIRKGYRFQTTRGKTRFLTTNTMGYADVYRMIRRRPFAASIKAGVGNHAFRSAGITKYLKNGVRQEIAQRMTAYVSARTTAQYDRQEDEEWVDDVERILN